MTSPRFALVALIVLLAAFAHATAPAEEFRPAAPGPSVHSSGTTFETWFRMQVEHSTTLPAVVLRTARRYQYVFVAGFLNEGFRREYFDDNRRALIDAGVAAESIHVVFPKSSNGVEENASLLRQTMSMLSAPGSQRFVVIGHSKGAVEVLAFALLSPAFVRDRVRALFLVQGAFGGSGIADYISGKGHKLDGGMPAAQRAEFAIAAGAGKLLDVGIDRGFQSLTHDGAAQIWPRLIPRRGGPESPPNLPDGLADRIAYIRASRAPEKVSPLFRVAAAYLGAYYGENDGLVEVKDQALAGVGTIITTLDADHASLMLSRPVSDQSDRVRRAFTQALLMQLSGAFDR